MDADAPRKGLSYTAISMVMNNPVRWRVLAALLRDDLLPASELAKRVGQDRSNLSKQLAVMRKYGVVEQWRGKLYRIPHRFRVAGQMAVDFGSALLRLDDVT